jgi:hypothetical protein
MDYPRGNPRYLIRPALPRASSASLAAVTGGSFFRLGDLPPGRQVTRLQEGIALASDAKKPVK